MLNTTQNEAVKTLTKLLKAHGYDPTQYDLSSIADEYQQVHGHYDMLENPSTIWSAVFDNEQHRTSTPPPANFLPRDWDAPEYDDTAPRDRFVVADGPESGGVESNWQPGWGVLIDLPPVGHTGDGLGIPLNDARQLLKDLQAVLDKIDQ